MTTLDGPVSLAAAGWLHTCTIPVGQPFVCWGNDEVGELGDGTAPAAAKRSIRHQVAFPALPSQRFLAHATPGEVVARGLSSRPVAVDGRAAARRVPVTPFTIMSMNVLGSNHTAPGADEPEMAPGRIRAEWASTYFRLRGASVMGLQESQPDQLLALDAATLHDFTFYPGTTLGYVGAPQSVMWKRSEWSLVWKSSISIPFTGGWRPQPIVELQQRSTGARIYVINVHFTARRAHQADRDKAMKILLPAIAKLQKDGLPILLTGDFNEVAPAFCSITGKTDLVAATGGSNTGGKCVLPPRPGSTGSSARTAPSPAPSWTPRPRYAGPPTTTCCLPASGPGSLRDSEHPQTSPGARRHRTRSGEERT